MRVAYRTHSLHRTAYVPYMLYMASCRMVYGASPPLICRCALVRSVRRAASCRTLIRCLEMKEGMRDAPADMIRSRCTVVGAAVWNT